MIGNTAGGATTQGDAVVEGEDVVHLHKGVISLASGATHAVGLPEQVLFGHLVPMRASRYAMGSGRVGPPVEMIEKRVHVKISLGHGREAHAPMVAISCLLVGEVRRLATSRADAACRLRGMHRRGRLRWCRRRFRHGFRGVFRYSTPGDAEHDAEIATGDAGGRRGAPVVQPLGEFLGGILQ